MGITIEQQDQVNSSPGTITPPSTANLLVVVGLHDRSDRGGDTGLGDVRWAGAEGGVQDSRRHQMRWFSGGTHEGAVMHLIPWPDVSGQGTFSWTAAPYHVRLYWLNVETGNPAAVIGDWLVTGSSPSADIGIAGGLMIYGLVTSSGSPQLGDCTVDESHTIGGEYIEWGHEQVDNDDGSATFGSGVILALALAEAGSPGVRVLANPYVATSGGSHYAPAASQYLVACGRWDNSGRNPPTSVTWDGEALTEQINDSQGTHEWVTIWTLASPATGSKVFSFDNSLRWELYFVDKTSGIIAATKDASSGGGVVDFSGDGMDGDLAFYSGVSNDPYLRATDPDPDHWLFSNHNDRGVTGFWPYGRMGPVDTGSGTGEEIVGLLLETTRGGSKMILAFSEAWDRWRERADGLLAPKGFDEPIWKPEPQIITPMKKAA